MNSDAVHQEEGDPLKILATCGGYYRCPKGQHQERLGPLVGYAGTYEAADHTIKHYVGEVFYNFAKVEQHTRARDFFARRLAHLFGKFLNPTLVIGAPMGGILLAESVGRMSSCRVIFAEKKVLALATHGARERSILTLDRHEVHPGDDVIIVEDVCNNFSTTDALMKLIADAEATSVAIVCAINRSEHETFGTLPVLSVIHVPTRQYQQEDPKVAADIARGNVVWKPKTEWAKLAPFMVEPYA